MKLKPVSSLLTGWMTIVFLLSCITVNAQDKVPDIRVGLGDGISFNAPDSSLGLNIGIRLQTQFYDDIELDEQSYRPVSHQPGVVLRRARLRFSGYILEEKFTYFTQLEFDKGRSYISNAEIRWHPGGGNTFAVGQFRIFEDRQDRMSSSRLQLVERAAVNGYFVQGYDVGGYWKGVWAPQSRFGIKAYASVTQGELLNNPTAEGGFQYNARLELLPLGRFASGGDYTATAFVSQPDPKLSLGISGSYNMDAYSLYGPGYSYGDDTDVLTVYTDYIFKYRRFSTFGEFIWREVENEVLRAPGDDPLLSEVIGGYGFFVQSGIMVSRNVEIAVRYEKIHPWTDDILKRILNPHSNYYSAGFNYYAVGDHIKFQSMVSLIEETNQDSGDRTLHVQPRLQFQLNF